jgi:hypothetical protein
MDKSLFPLEVVEKLSPSSEINRVQANSLLNKRITAH